MNENAVFKISYGLFYLGSEHNGDKNVCIVNTVAQVTQEPLRVSVTILKTSKTCELIKASKKFSVGILGVESSLDYIKHFGETSGHELDKLEGYNYKTDKLLCPLIEDNCLASLCCSVMQEVDLGTHMLFVADLVDAEVLSDSEPMTYNEYRRQKSGLKPATSGEPAKEAWQCTVCHYVYDGDIPFEDLDDDYICPVCKKPKSVFIKA